MGGSNVVVDVPDAAESPVQWVAARQRTRVAAIRQDVLAQAAGDMMDLSLEDGTVVATVPRAPFMHWALHRTSLRHLAPPWRCVSPSGMKVAGDDRYHSDWFYGATFVGPAAMVIDPDEYPYDGNLDKAAQREMFELQWRLGNFSCEVVVDAGDVEGLVGRQIVVLPNLQPDHLSAILSASGIVTQAGGKLAHLAQLALERRITILRVPDACRRFVAGTRLTLQPAAGRIRVAVDRR